MTSASYFHARGRRSTHSRATDQRASKHHGSRRFDWRWCWPYAVGGCSLVCIGAGLNAVASFDVSEPIGEIFWSSASTLAAIFGAIIGISAWWPDLEAEKQAADAKAQAELEEATRQFGRDAERMRFLKAEWDRLNRHKKSRAAVEAEMQEIQHRWLGRKA